MKITLMCKDIPVCSFNIDTVSGWIQDKIATINVEYLPLSVQYSHDSTSALKNWIDNRSVSVKRKDLAAMLNAYGVETPAAISFKNLGLNLSDQYWFKPEGFELDWEDVNLFENDFKKQSFKSIKFGESSYSPDSSSNGELPKFWCIEDNKRILYKEGTAPYDQQPYNEVFASKLLTELGLPHVDYKLVYDDEAEQAYCTCETFITPDTEYVPALEIRSVLPKLNHEDTYQHFLRCMEKLEIVVEPKEIDNMLVFDYLIHNSDRHYGNFGFIRDVNTQQFIGMAPIFDNGNSLWYQEINKQMKFRKQPSKPFKETQEEQLKLIKTANLELDKLSPDKVDVLIDEVFTANPLFDTERLENLKYNLRYTRTKIIERVSFYSDENIARLKKSIKQMERIGKDN